MMVLNIGDMFAGYPTTATNTKVPYVMFPGTPYAHLMDPVKYRRRVRLVRSGTFGYV
jgi:hypothetical protein